MTSFLFHKPLLNLTTLFFLAMLTACGGGSDSAGETDTTAPVISLNGDYGLYLQLEDSYEEQGANAVDDTDGNIDVRITGTVGTTPGGIYKITYSATDTAGNTTTLDRTVYVLDSEAPMLTLLGESIMTLALGDTYDEPGFTTSDNSSEELSLTTVGAVDTSVIDTYRISYTAIDSTGNSITVTRIVNVVDYIDTQPPVITLKGDNPLVMNVGEIFDDPFVSVSDDTGGFVKSDVSHNIKTDAVGSYTVTYTITDQSGNSSKATRTVNVVDASPPVITLIGDNPQVVVLGSDYIEQGVSVSDNVDASAAIDIITQGSADTSVIASYTIIYSATDSAGNQSELKRMVNVVEPEVAILKLFASTQQLASSGAQTILLSAIAQGTSDDLLEGVTIGFTSDSGSLQPVVEESKNPNITGPDGKVEMILSTEGEPENRVITVTATVGDYISDNIEVAVIGTKLNLTGSASLAIDDDTPYLIHVIDSDGNGIADTEVTISLSDNSNNITIPTSVITDTEGQAIISATGILDGANSIVVSALNATATKDVSIHGDSFIFTSFTNGSETVDPSVTPLIPDVALNQTANATLTWQREGAVVADGTEVTFTTTRGVLSAGSATTVDGNVSVSLNSFEEGKALITFVGNDTIGEEEIELTNYLEFEFFREIASTIHTQASVHTLAPNGQTSTISAIARDANGNLLADKKIKFLLSDIGGGTIFPSTAITDSSGKATTVFTSNATSAKDAVAIIAFVEESPEIADTIRLTVSEPELFISLGAGDIVELSSTDYVKEYTVFVTDVDSNPVENVALTIAALPEIYHKGFWLPTYDLDGGEFVAWVAAGFNSTIAVLPTTECPNEDLNFNGILDDGEDTNGDGVLTPGNIVSISGDFVTDHNGQSVVNVIYAKIYGNWLDIKLVVSGKIDDRESSTEVVFNLPVRVDDVNQEGISPPQQGINARGPFGVSTDCSESIAEDPDSNTN